METITCRMIDFAEDPDYVPVPGDMWFETGEEYGYHVSANYLRDSAAKRKPLWVCLSGLVWFPIDSAPTNGGDGWTVTGDPPAITVSPSINVVGIWHGWLRNGVLTEA